MHVNFLPKQQLNLDLKTLRSFTLTRRSMTAIALGILMFMSVFGMAQKLRMGHLQKKQAMLESSNDEIRKNMTGEDLARVRTLDKGGIFTEYEKKTVWSNVLKDIADHTPPHVWYSSLSVGENGSIELIGRSLDHITVSRLIKMLGDVPIFGSVKLTRSETLEKDGKNELEFVVQCLLK